MPEPSTNDLYLLGIFAIFDILGGPNEPHREVEKYFFLLSTRKYPKYCYFAIKILLTVIFHQKMTHEDLVLFKCVDISRGAGGPHPNFQNLDFPEMYIILFILACYNENKLFRVIVYPKITMKTPFSRFFVILLGARPKVWGPIISEILRFRGKYFGTLFLTCRGIIY